MNATPVKKWLIRLHRCLAIALCIPFLVWFGSGIAMIYAGGMPRLTAAERLRPLDAIAVSQVRLSSFEAQVAACAAQARNRFDSLADRDASPPGGPPVSAACDAVRLCASGGRGGGRAPIRRGARAAGVGPGSRGASATVHSRYAGRPMIVSR